MTTFTRSFPLEDIAIRSGGDGRTVEAYAAVFGAPVEIKDGQGHYLEQIDRAAFNKTLADNGTRFGVFYNHGTTLHGTPSERASMPLGTPLEVRADERGLWTVTRYNRTELADDVLESIRNGDIRGQSFSGRFVRADVDVPRGGFRPLKDGSLRTVTRLEIAMREYGPTPFPAYSDAVIIGVRSLAAQLAQLDDDDRAELARLLGPATRNEPTEPTGTPAAGAAAEEPQTHSGRLTPAQRARAGAILRGI